MTLDPGATGQPAPPLAAGQPAPASVRPPQVTVAVALTFVGIGIAFAGVLLLFLSGIDAAAPGGAAQTRRAATVAIVLAAGNLLTGLGAAVAATFTLRGSNAARIVLCALCALFATWKLTCGGLGLVNLYGGDAEISHYGLAITAYSLDLVLMVLALAIFALLLTGPSHRYVTTPQSLPVYAWGPHLIPPEPPVEPTRELTT